MTKQRNKTPTKTTWTTLKLKFEDSASWYFHNMLTTEVEQYMSLKQSRLIKRCMNAPKPEGRGRSDTVSDSFSHVWSLSSVLLNTYICTNTRTPGLGPFVEFKQGSFCLYPSFLFLTILSVTTYFRHLDLGALFEFMNFSKRHVTVKINQI